MIAKELFNIAKNALIGVDQEKNAENVFNSIINECRDRAERGHFKNFEWIRNPGGVESFDPHRVVQMLEDEGFRVDLDTYGRCNISWR